MAKKTYVVDTNVILHDAEALNTFGTNDVVIPGSVIEELDRMKRMKDHIGRNARQAMRFVDNIGSTGDLQSGITLVSGPCLRVTLGTPTVCFNQFPLKPDRSRYRFFCTVYDLKNKGEDVVVVSKDSITRIIADAMGVVTKNYANSRVFFDNMHTGISHIDTPKILIDQFYKDGYLPIPEKKVFLPNDFCILKSQENSSAVCRVDSKKQQLVPLIHINKDMWGIKPRNIEQKCALELLLDDSVKLVNFVGPAGTGKTLLALAAGLRMVFDEGRYGKIIITRSIVPLGKDIGFLPGTKEEKLQAWMGAFYDNLEQICNTTKEKDMANETKNWILNSNKVQVEAITYMRGRSIADAYVIIDEAQNLSLHEIKTLVSRVGPKTKVVVIGDPTQIDNTSLDADSNGLVHLTEKMKDYSICGSIFFKQTERSPLADLASKVL